MMRISGSKTIRAFDRSVAQALLCAIALFLLSMYFGTLQDWDLADIGRLSFFISLPVLLFVVRLTPRNFWSAPSVYLVVFFVFHFGLAVVSAFHLSMSGGRPSSCQI